MGRGAETMDRKAFLATLVGAASATLAGCQGNSGQLPTARGLARLGKLGQLERPLAIAMWDFSWILRHHRLGEFADWDGVLDELVLRGYDAVRIDCMPQFVARGPDAVSRVGPVSTAPPGSAPIPGINKHRRIHDRPTIRCGISSSPLSRSTSTRCGSGMEGRSGVGQDPLSRASSFFLSVGRRSAYAERPRRGLG